MPFVLDGVNRYAAEDNRYTASPKTVTIKRFGPSASSKKKNSILALIIAVTPNTSKEIAFDLKYRFLDLSVMA
nr:hypothetical protein [Pedobacter sp. ASV19]